MQRSAPMNRREMGDRLKFMIVRKTGGVVHGNAKSYPRILQKLEPRDVPNLPRSKSRYATIAVGGTFDILHAGHEKLLARAFDLADQVLIGVSGDELVSALHKGHSVTPFKVRVRKLRRFLESRGWIRRARISELRDAFGPALRRKRLQALVVSEETHASALKLNQIRRQNGLSPLRLHVVKLVRARDGKPISASRIRRGEIDPTGKTTNKGQ